MVYALKQERPANLWEYYICLELRSRIEVNHVVSSEIARQQLSTSAAFEPIDTLNTCTTFPCGAAIGLHVRRARVDRQQCERADDRAFQLRHDSRRLQ